MFSAYLNPYQVSIILAVLVNFKFTTFFYFFYFISTYIHPPNSQESDGGAIHKASNYRDLLLEMPKYCCPLEILIKI